MNDTKRVIEELVEEVIKLKKQVEKLEKTIEKNQLTEEPETNTEEPETTTEARLFLNLFFSTAVKDWVDLELRGRPAEIMNKFIEGDNLSEDEEEELEEIKRELEDQAAAYSPDDILPASFNYEINDFDYVEKID